MKKAIGIGVLGLFTAACAVGPRYQPPAVSLPEAYRGGEAEQPAPSPDSLADLEWSQVFQDEALRQLIRAGLERNLDLRMAAARILQAQAQVGFLRADEFPTVDGNVQWTSLRTASSRFTAFEISELGLQLSSRWEVDFWKKFRSTTQAAQASLLASEAARQAVIRTLVAEIAAAYFELRELDAELEVSRRTLATRQQSLDLIRLLADRGLTSLLDVRQAEQLVYTVSGTIPELERQMAQKENQISILTGTLPAAIARGVPLAEQPLPAEVPAGLPSALLQRRPDILELEQRLIALNAEINSVRARAFPSMALTAAGGFQSSALTSLFSAPAGLWNFAGSLTQPIFQKGKLRAGVRLAEARQQEALLAYEKAVQQAFREVSDALIAYRKSREIRQQQALLVEAAREAARLANLRYQGGVSSYLEVLTTETNVYAAERGLAQAHLAQQLAFVQLYKALGGGWRP